VAALIDGVVLLITGCVVGGVVGGMYGALTGTAEGVEYLGNLIGLVIGWLYHAILESSPVQASLGKMALGIRVTDMNGDRISFGRATGRHFAKILSGLLLLIGYIMAGFTEKKQALHDIMASCLVVKK